MTLSSSNQTSPIPLLTDEYLRHILEDSLEYAVVALDPAGMIVSWSPTAEKLFGYPAAEVLGQSGKIIFTEEDRRNGVPEEEMTLALEKGRAADERWHARKDGSLFFGSGAMTPIRAEAGEFLGFVKAVRDRTDYKKTVDSMKEKARLISLANLIVRDRDNKIVFWSKGAVEDFGFTQEEALGKISHELLKTEFPVPLAHIEEEFKRLGHWQGELISTTKGGRKVASASRWVANLGPDQTVSTILEVNNDITTRRKAEQERQEALAKLNILLANAPVGIGFLDQDLRYVHVNEALAEMNGRPVPDHIGRRVQDVLPGADGLLERLLEEVVNSKEAQLNRELSTGELGIQGPGRYFSANFFPVFTESKQLLGVGTIVWDITDQKQTRGKIKRILESITDMYLSLDSEGRVIDINSKAQAFMNEPREALIGKVLWEVLPYVKTNSQLPLQRALAERTPVHFEAESTMAPGRWSEVHAYPTETGLEVYFREITGRKQAEGKLIERGKRLGQSNRELEQFAYAASHDLQGPLRTITNFADLAAEKIGAGQWDGATEFLRRISAAAERMSKLISDLLAFARLGSFKGHAGAGVDLNSVLRDVKNDLDQSIGQTGAEIQSEPLPVVKADSALMHELLQNLIGNAIKYHSSERPRIRLKASRTGSFWEISVEDNGIGFDPKYKETIFDVFTRLHGSGRYEGSGMGLAICKRIVERYGGQIWAESVPGKGSTFHFTLPAATESKSAK